MKYIVYKISTGDIVSIGETPGNDLPPDQDTWLNWIEGEIPFGSTDFYVSNKKLVERPAQPNIYYDWNGSEWIPNLEVAANYVKYERDQLLAESDWTELVGAANRLGAETYAKWQSYRQQLRDITNQEGYPLDVVWPVKPE